MAFTYATLLSTVESYLQTTETDFVANFPTMVIQAEDRIFKRVVLPANRTTSAPTVTSGNNSISLPAGFLAPFSLHMIVSGAWSAVTIVDVGYMREAFPDPTTAGTPRYYAMSSDSTLTVAPTPTTGITSSLNYFYKPESITTALTSWLGTNAENVLLYGVLSECYTFLKGDNELQQLYETKFQAALSDLKRLGEGMDMGDSWRFGEVRVSRG